MKKILVTGILKHYAKIAFFFYYKKIKIVGLDKLPKGKPIFFLPNHQNALIDPLLIGTHIKGFASYLTRASAFKKPIIAKFLRLIGLLPIYRVRDGYETLNKNQAIFDECIEVLAKNGKILAFPEATHNIQRRVRNLSKGFTRIVFQELEQNPNSDLQLIPVGFNYQAADKCPDSVAILIGEAIPAKKYSQEMNPQSLRIDIQHALKQLTTHIPQEEYADVESRLQEYDVDFLDPKTVNRHIANNFSECKEKKVVKPGLLKTAFRYLLILNLLLPYLLWKYKFKPNIREVEFIATLRYTVAITLVPLYLLVIFIILALLFSLKVALAYIVFVLLVDLLYIKT